MKSCYPTMLLLFFSALISYGQSPQVPGCMAKFTLYTDTTQANRFYAIEQSTGTKPITYNWGWGDGNFSQGQYVSHTYTDTGTFIICLYISDTLSCTNLFCDSNVHITATGTSISTVPELPAGIDAPAIENIFHLFPNPTTGKLTIQTTGFAPTLATIYNMQGQKVGEEKYRSTMDVSALTSGIYFIELTGGESVVRRRFVKE